MRLSHYGRNFLHRRVMLNYSISHYVRNCLHRNVGFILSMKLSNYGRNFLHRHAMLNYTNSHYVRNCLHRNVGFILSMKRSNYGRNFLHRPVVLNLFIYYLTTLFITNINQLHEIGKDLKWRTTYLESTSLPVKRLYEARGCRSRAYSWASLPCLWLAWLDLLSFFFLFLFFFFSPSLLLFFSTVSSPK